MRILKIGGSLITEKSEDAFEVAREDVIERIAGQIEGKLILVHGVGSFGHPHVKKFGLTPHGIAITHLACLKINHRFCTALAERGMNPVPVHPLEFFHRPDFELVRELVDRGFIPVMHGDVVYENGRFRVISGDEIVRIFAERFDVEAVGFASDTQVIVDGRKVDFIDISNAGEFLERIGIADGKHDVTGGMRGKLREAMKIAEKCDVYIFNGLEENAVRDFLQGMHVGTRIGRKNL